MSYYAYGLFMIASTIGGVVALAASYRPVFAPFDRSVPGLGKIAFACTFAGLIFVIPRWVRWLYRRATEPLQRLQRETAVMIAREAIRKRMAQARGRWWR
jgi:hypothetical protein